jgi:hypothetical protein
LVKLGLTRICVGWLKLFGWSKCDVPSHHHVPPRFGNGFLVHASQKEPYFEFGHDNFENFKQKWEDTVIP